MPDNAQAPHQAQPSRDIASLAGRLGHDFADITLLERALTHSSRAYEAQSADEGAAATRGLGHNGVRELDRGNEQMEFLGDAVLGMLVADWLYRHQGKDNEGRLTRLRAALVSRRNLSRVAARLGLGDYLRLGRGEERSGGRQKTALLADAVEAVIAAVFLDGGLAAASALVEREIVLSSEESNRRGTPLEEIEDWKSAVQEWLQARGLGRATYALLSADGMDHAKRFTVELRLGREPMAQSTASSKKQAEQACARTALEIFRSRESA